MTRAQSAIMVAAAFLLLVLGACRPDSTATPTAPAPKTTAPIVGTKPSWEEDWQNTLSAAKKEGRLNIFSAAAPQFRTETTNLFRDKFGLSIELTTGSGAEIAEKLLAERRAGLYTADLITGSTLRQLTVMKPGGMLDPIKPLLVLPEVLDKTLWYGGDIPWVDNEKMYTISSLLTPYYTITINTSMVRPDEITSYNDLLGPRWKEKIAVGNPIVLNPRMFSQIAYIMGVDWWRKLVANSPMIVGNHRLGMEWVAQGKYPIYMGSTELLQEFVTAGAPVTRAMPREGSFLTGGALATSLLNHAPHPNAAKIFANWYLSKEGNILQSRAIGIQSARLDVPTDHLRPDMLRDPSSKYVNAETEEFQLRMAKDADIAREIFAPLLK